MLHRSHSASAFDLAPRQRKGVAWKWAFLALSIGLLVFSGWRYAQARVGYEQLGREAAARRAEAGQAALWASQAKARAESPAELRRQAAERKLQGAFSFDWFELFSSLEAAAAEVKGGVSVMSLVPSIPDSTASRVQVSAAAASTDMMLEYLRIVQMDRRVLKAELVSHEEEIATGRPLVRFQLTLDWKNISPATAQPAPREAINSGKGPGT